MNSPSMYSGDENSVLSAYKDDAFDELLATDAAQDVEICNFDLSVCIPARAVVQNKTQDTRLKTLNRQILVKIGTLKAGMYVKIGTRYWLVIGLVDNNMVYEKAVVILCNYCLAWLDSNNQPVQRWCNVTSASQYNNGESGDVNRTFRSDTLMVLTPDDEECLMLDSGKRFIVDQRCEIYSKYIADDVMQDTSHKVAVYEVTRTDSVLFDYLDSGHFEFMLTQCEQGEKDGFYRINGNGYWLCDGYEPNHNEPEEPNLHCKIVSDVDVIYNGIDETRFSPVFFDKDENEIDVEPIWEVKCDFLDKLLIRYDGKSILIFTDDYSLTNKSFELSLSGKDVQVSTSKQVKIVACF